MWRSIVSIYHSVNLSWQYIYIINPCSGSELYVWASSPTLYIMGRKPLSCLASPCTCGCHQYGKNLSRNNEEFSLYVVTYALTLPSWTLDQVEHMIYLSFYIFIFKTFTSGPLLPLIYYMAFCFLWKRGTYLSIIFWVTQVAVIKNKSAFFLPLSQKH